MPFVRIEMLSGRSTEQKNAPQKWHFRQSIDYEITDNYAVMDIASKRKEDFLFNIWRMGMNSIERGRSNRCMRRNLKGTAPVRYQQRQ